MRKDLSRANLTPARRGIRQTKSNTVPAGKERSLLRESLLRAAKSTRCSKANDRVDEWNFFLISQKIINIVTKLSDNKQISIRYIV